MSKLVLGMAYQIFVVSLAGASMNVAIGEENGVFTHGPKRGDWLVRGSVIRVKAFTEAAAIQGIGGRIEAPDKTSPGLDISYFVNDNWVVEIQGGTFEREYSVKNSAIGNFSVGTVDTGALSLALQYHYRPTKLVRAYLGAGMNYAWCRSVRPAENIPMFNVEPIISSLVDAGLDFYLADHWILNASARYILSPTYDFRGEGFSAEVRINTLILGTGIGFYF